MPAGCFLFRADRRVRLAVVIGLAAIVSSIGCSKGADVTLQATIPDPNQTSPTNGHSDGWTNTNLTPSGFAIGIQSASLTNSTTTDNFTIFDQGTGAPLFTRLYSSPTIVTVASQTNVRNGTYDQVTLQVVFYEAAIQVWDAFTAHTRRLRYYFSDATDPLIGVTVDANDLLLSRDDFAVPVIGTPDQVGTTSGTDLQWMNPTNGSFCSPRSSCTNGITSNSPYQGNTSFLAGIFASYPMVTIPISPITVDSSTNATFVVHLTLGTGGLFFYDNTDASAGQFNYLSLSTSSLDGKIDAACTNPSTCASTDLHGPADFWIGPPQFSAAVTSQ
jgi:hypothetical protein